MPPLRLLHLPRLHGVDQPPEPRAHADGEAPAPAPSPPPGDPPSERIPSPRLAQVRYLPRRKPTGSDPRWPYPFTWDDALERELLIDVGEWAECHGLSLPLTLPTALTPDLCDAIENLPFSPLCRRDVETRMCDVIHQLERTLARVLEPPVAGDPARVQHAFAAPLPSPHQKSHWRCLSLYCGPNDRSETVAIARLADA